MKKYLLLLTILPFLASCENTWDGESKDMFLQACMNTAKESNMDDAKAKQMCDCRLEKVMKKHPNFSDAMENILDVVNDPELKECEPKE